MFLLGGYIRQRRKGYILCNDAGVIWERGPDTVKLGRSVFYRRADVEAWIALNVCPMDRVASAV